MSETVAVDLAKHGPWALVVGGSEGIGAACARRLAAQGFNIVLIARKQKSLRLLVDELSAFGIEVRHASIDLSLPYALDQTRVLTDHITIGLLLYIAGANDTRGNFLELEPRIYRSVIAINVLGQIEFSRHYGGLMLSRGRGGIVLAGSLSNFLGSATLASYTASKAFSRIFSEALWAECQGTGVDVLHVVVGYTDTPAMRRLGLDTTVAQRPEEAAREILAAIGNGPLLLLGGEANIRIASRRSQVEDRGALIRTASTPRRESIVHTES